VDLEIHWQDRIAVTGPNGAGKTTLLRLLTGARRPTSGSARLGAGVVVGQLWQERTLSFGNPATTLLEAVCDQADLSLEEARSLLAKFDLTAGHTGRTQDELSPGECARAGLAVLVARGTNLLALDEPSNHLDLDALEELERALDDFDGTLLVVTHDRRLLERLRLSRRLEVEAGAVREVGVAARE
jgi:ATPase subunit of ABC transporter with duplicated ATPase domains